LESEGGFSSLNYDENATFKSSLAANATVRWSKIQAKKIEASGPSPLPSSKANLKLEFPTANWELLQKAYGWSSLQYQAWARGYLRSRTPQLLMMHLHCLGVLEVIIDGRRHFGGDFYSFRRAPLVLRINPGEHVLHTIDVRLIRDIRAMGGRDAALEVQLEVQGVRTGVELVEDSLLISDVVNGKLASDLGSIILRNNGEEPAVVTDSELNGKVIVSIFLKEMRYNADCFRRATYQLSHWSQINHLLSHLGKPDPTLFGYVLPTMTSR
jgi:hypothetical protein